MIPDLSYDRSRLPSATMMEIEKYRFDNLSIYDPGNTSKPVIPEYAYLLQKIGRWKDRRSHFRCRIKQTEEYRNKG